MIKRLQKIQVFAPADGKEVPSVSEKVLVAGKVDAMRYEQPFNIGAPMKNMLCILPGSSRSANCKSALLTLSMCILLPSSTTVPYSDVKVFLAPLIISFHVWKSNVLNFGIRCG